MMDQLVFYESRAAAADPHRDMRLDIDNMSYEVNTTFCFFPPLALQIWAFLLTLPLDCPQDLLALGEFMGNVNTGLADEKILKCVREVVCCSSDQTQNDLDDQDDGRCVICLVHFCNTSLNWCLYNHVPNWILTDGCIMAGGLQRQGCAGNTEMQPWLPRWLHQEVAADEEFMPGVQSSRGLGHQWSTNCAPRSIDFRLRSYYPILFFPP